MLLKRYTLCAGFNPTGSASASTDGQADFPGDAAAIIRVSGPLTRDSWWRGIPVTYLVSLLKEVEATGDYGAAILDLNSPGGDVSSVASALDYLAAPSRRLKVYSSVEMAASAAYWIASHTDGVYLQNDISACVGSIGTMISWSNFDGIYEKAGAVITDIYPEESPLKNAAERAAQKGDYEPYKKMLSQFARKFQDSVRAVRPNVTEDALKGEIFIGRAGIDAGLADGIVPLDALVEKIQAAGQLRNQLK